MPFHVNPSQPFDEAAENDFRSWFPKERPLPPDHTFEFGLVLAGAVSAGAYTAGVMDFLFEALDRWHEAKAGDADVPRHNVSLRILTGASAGGMNAAIVAAACRKLFPHVRDGNAEDIDTGNPFYDAWVREVRIEDLLAPGDIADGEKLRSVLNCRKLWEIMEGILDFEGEPADVAHRPWLEDPFRVVLTLTNLTGVPYAVRFTGATDLFHEMTLHRDEIGFGVPVFGAPPDKAFPPDVIALSQTPSSDDDGWRSLGTAALATGAFPLALEPQLIARQPTDYEYRYAYINSEGRKIYAKPWPGRRPEVHRFLSVDGGTMNNEPFEVARRFLAGSEGSNEREGTKAHRAVIMVDPFTDPGAPYELVEAQLPAIGARLLTAFKQQARFNQLDLSLAEADDIYSRFMIAPSRARKKGVSAIASGGLGGFLGFFHESFRHHDFMLGRANCQRFLRDWFVLPEQNSLFKSATWSADALRNPAYGSQSRQGHLQIIPLADGLHKDLVMPAWPSGKFSGYEDLRDKIEKRVDAVFGSLRDDLLGGLDLNWATRFAAKGYIWLPWRSFGRGKLLKLAKESIDGAARRIDQDSL